MYVCFFIWRYKNPNWFQFDYGNVKVSIKNINLATNFRNILDLKLLKFTLCILLLIMYIIFEEKVLSLGLESVIT